jgi:hypothetical protein
MLSNRNNHLIKLMAKKQKGGLDEPQQQPLVQPQQQPLAQPQQSLAQQQPLAQPQPLQQPQPLVEEPSYPNPDYLYNNITSQELTDNIKVYMCLYSIGGTFGSTAREGIEDSTTQKPTYIKYYMQQSSTIMFPTFTFTNQQPLQQQPLRQETAVPLANAPSRAPKVPLQQGGYIDSNDSGDPLDALFIQKCKEFSKTLINQEPVYAGYIPNIAEPGSVYVFIQVPSGQAPSVPLVPCISNELFYIGKVGSIDVDATIKTMFQNNKWLVSAADPFSGYACAKDLLGNFINVPEGTNPEIIDIDSLGQYYIFSFTPLVAREQSSQAKEPQVLSGKFDRYILFPQDYVCIKTIEPDFELEENSIYLDGALVPNKQMFALASPTQFIKF